MHTPYCKENPNRVKRARSPNAGRKKGGIPWNKGLKDDPRQARPEQKGKLFGASLNGHTQESKDKISEKMKGNTNAHHRGDRQSFYNEIRMDSSWEVGVAHYLENNSYNWSYGKRSYVLSDGRHYFPDFFVYDETNKLVKLIEVKGYFREENKMKFDQFRTEYPDVVVELWNKDKLVTLDIINKSGYVKPLN
jgi:hypothetical protein